MSAPLRLPGGRPRRQRQAVHSIRDIRRPPRETIERSIGRLPRRIAYPLILLFSALFWIPIGIWLFRDLLPWLARLL